jgi:hypothetical protein
MTRKRRSSAYYEELAKLRKAEENYREGRKNIRKMKEAFLKKWSSGT